MRKWHIYIAPNRGPETCLVQLWELRDGRPVAIGDPIPAPNLTAARGAVPAGLTRKPAAKDKREAPNLLETWE